MSQRRIARSLQKAPRPAPLTFGPGTSTRSLSNEARQLGGNRVGDNQQNQMQGYSPWGGATQGSATGDQPVQFGPGKAPEPSPIGGDPRQFQYRTGYNYPSLPGEGRLVSYDTLRQIASIDWLTRKAIEVVKNEVCAMHFDITATAPDARAKRKILESHGSRIEEIHQFFLEPDGRHSFQTWLRMLLEDHFVLDALCFYKHRNQDPDAGPELGGKRMGKLIGLLPVDGATIKPLMDDGGRMPLHPLPAYQQFIYGYPRADFFREELAYRPRNLMTYSNGYGFSAVEQFIYLVNLNLRYWTFQGARFTDGTLPEGVGEAPPNWTTAQIMEFQELWDQTLAGDPRALRKLHFVPNGFSWHEFKQQTFEETLARFLVDTMAVAFDVSPMELGYEPSHGGLGGKGLGENAAETTERRSLKPRLNWIFDDILNPVLAYEFGAPDLIWTTKELDEEYENDRSEAIDRNIKNGLMSLDEAIEENGGTPIGAGRLFVLGTIALGEPDLIKLTKEGWAALGIQAAPAAGGPPGSQDPNKSDGSPQAQGSSNGDNPDQTTKAAAPGPNERELDLRRWETKAVRAARMGKSPNVRFESEFIRLDLQDAIRGELVGASTPDDVRAAFRKAATTTVAARMENLIDAELVTS